LQDPRIHGLLLEDITQAGTVDQFLLLSVWNISSMDLASARGKNKENSSKAVKGALPASWSRLDFAAAA